ncbi:GerAB/ArcD/ProY family transporter [Paenibacillus durus]|uniref:GerAB/ArcD/ProY family transporter n=1 Tax=Paenibacillus durus TaxID=44251 RepID=UPI0022A97A87|nr:GerAB/ArcD/ProY family transporter [Paenibacillus durus]
MTQSFGETLIFAMLWVSLNKPEQVMKTSIYAVLLSGFCILLLNLFAIAVFGEGIYLRSIFPLYILIRQINIGNFITNLDALGVLYFCITSFFKFSIYLYAVARGFQQLLFLKSYRMIIWPAALCILFIGMTMASSQKEHIEVGMNIYPRFQILLLLALPAILLLVTCARKVLTKRS